MFEKRWNIKNLYITYPALLTCNTEKNVFYFNEAKEKLQPIIVKKINYKYVMDILTNRTYAISSRLDPLEFQQYLNEYVVLNLVPLEKYDIFQGKNIFSKTELKKLLIQGTNENCCEIKDPFLVCILETIEIIKNLELNLEEKSRLGKKLNNLLDYYSLGLKKINHIDSEFNSIVTSNNLPDLREECLQILVDIKESIPCDLTDSDNDIKILRKEIDSLIN